MCEVKLCASPAHSSQYIPKARVKNISSCKGKRLLEVSACGWLLQRDAGRYGTCALPVKKGDLCQP